MSLPPDALQAIAIALEHMYNVNLLRAATLVLLAYEYLLTFDLEVNLIWKEKWNVGKILFILTRYLPFFDTTISIALQFLPHASVAKCNALYAALIWVFLIGIAVAEAVLSLRTWAVCGKQKTLGICLSILYVGVLGAQIGLVSLFSKSLTFELQTALNPILRGCLVTGGKSDLFIINWSLLVVYDAVNMVLMMTPAYYSFREGSSSFVRVVLRDGLIYYSYIFAIALANVAVLSKLSKDYFTIILLLGRVMHSIFACRVVLRTREEGSKTYYTDSFPSIPTSME